MTYPVQLLTHEEDAVNRLVDYLKEKPTVVALISGGTCQRVSFRGDTQPSYTVTVGTTNYIVPWNGVDSFADISAKFVTDINLANENYLATQTPGEPFFYIFQHAVPGDAIVVTGSTGTTVDSNSPVGQIQELENTLFDFLNSLSVAGAEGPALDALGEIVGASRYAGQNDSNFREIILIQILANRSHGEAWRLIEILQRLTSSTTVTLTEYFPASIIMYFDGVVDSPSTVANIMRRAKAGGVGLNLVSYLPTTAFSFFEDPTPGLGFDTLASPGSGGTLATIIL